MTSRKPDWTTNENVTPDTLGCAPALPARGDVRTATEPAGQKARDFGLKFVSAERALAAIRAGSRIYVGTGCAAPRSLLATLEAMVPGSPDLEFVSFVTTSALPQVEGACHTRYRHRTFFVGSEVRHLAGSGQLDYVPISLEEVPELLTSGRLRIDVALLQVSPPDARGYVSLGVSVDLAPAVLSVARSVIAEVNPAMPRTHGESFVHLDRFDALVNVDVPVAEYLHPRDRGARCTLHRLDHRGRLDATDRVGARAQ
jgi:acyl-CoA hydrolase